MTRAEICDIAEPSAPLREGGRSIVVLKFGGTALCTPPRLGLAALRVREQVRLGLMPVVVVSSGGSTADRLLHDMRSLCRERGDMGAGAQREIDRALVTGETFAAALLAAAIAGLGIRAESVSARDAVLLATGPQGAARLSELKPGRLARLLDQRIIPVVAGFQGVLEDGELVTLGKGSSDITSVFLASQLRAIACHVVTDVSGVHDEDPKVVPGSPRHSALTFQRLVEMAEQGAGVVHPQAARAAHDDSVPLHIYHYRAELVEPEGTFVGHL